VDEQQYGEKQRMAVIDKFLGKTVEVPEDRRYDAKQNLWGKKVDRTILFGLTQPALVLLSGVKDLDWLLEEGQLVQPGESAAFAITGKILYIDTPVAGTIHYNKIARKNPTVVSSDPYGEGWLFMVQPDSDIDQAYQSLVSAEQYLEDLRKSEGFKNPNGLKGGVSGICKAVYSGIGQQKI
jgi:glycine cleavage system H protein